LRSRLFLLGESRLLVRRRLVLDALDQLDPVVDQIGVEVLDLLLGEVDFLQPRDDLVVGEEPLFLPFSDELVQLFDVGQRDVDREHCSPSASRYLCYLTPTERKEPERSRIPPLTGTSGRGFYNCLRKAEGRFQDSATISPTASPRLLRMVLTLRSARSRRSAAAGRSRRLAAASHFL